MLFALVYCAAALLAALAATAHRGWLVRAQPGGAPPRAPPLARHRISRPPLPLQALLCAPLRPCARDAAAVAVVVVGWAAVRCARRMHASLVALSAALSPRWAPPCEPPWALVAAAFVVAQALLLAAAARTLACSTVLWAGTEYTRKGGRVVRVTQAPSPGHDTHGTR